jgi:hypothetical protein
MIAVSNYFSLLFLAEGIVMPRTVGKKGQRYCIEKSWSVTALVEQDEIVAVHAFEIPVSPNPVLGAPSLHRSLTRHVARR